MDMTSIADDGRSGRRGAVASLLAGPRRTAEHTRHHRGEEEGQEEVLSQMRYLSRTHMCYLSRTDCLPAPQHLPGAVVLCVQSVITDTRLPVRSGYRCGWSVAQQNSKRPVLRCVGGVTTGRGMGGGGAGGTQGFSIACLFDPAGDVCATVRCPI